MIKKSVFGLGIAGMVLASWNASSTIKQPEPQERRAGECVPTRVTVSRECIEEIVRTGHCIEYETEREERDYIETSRITRYGPKGGAYKTIKQGLEELKNPTTTIYVSIEGINEEGCLNQLREEGYCMKDTSSFEQAPFKQTLTTFRYASKRKE